MPLDLYAERPTGGSHRAISHPLCRVFHDESNAAMTSFVFRETLMMHLLLRGNAYAQVIINGRSEVIGLYPLLPSKMSVERDSDTGLLRYTYRPQTTGKPPVVVLSPADVLHIPGLDFDGLLGYSPIQMASNANLWPGLTRGQVLSTITRLRGGNTVLEQERHKRFAPMVDLDVTWKVRHYSKGNRQSHADLCLGRERRRGHSRRTHHGTGLCDGESLC